MKTKEKTVKVLLATTDPELREYVRILNEGVRLKRLPVTFDIDQDNPLETRLKKVRECDILIVLSSNRYGRIPSREEGGDGRKSLAWIEVEAALEVNKSVYAYLFADHHVSPLKPGDSVKERELLENFRKFIKTNDMIENRALGNANDLTMRVLSLITNKLNELTDEFKKINKLLVTENSKQDQITIQIPPSQKKWYKSGQFLVPSIFVPLLVALILVFGPYLLKRWDGNTINMDSIKESDRPTGKADTTHYLATRNDRTRDHSPLANNQSPGNGPSLDPYSPKIVFNLTHDNHSLILDSLKKSLECRRPQPLEYGKPIREMPDGTSFYLSPRFLSMDAEVETWEGIESFECFKISENVILIFAFTSNEHAVSISRLDGIVRRNLTLSTIMWEEHDCLILLPLDRIIEKDTRDIRSTGVGELTILDAVVK